MFQPMKPKIHLLYSEMIELIRTLMSKFVKSKLLYDEQNGSKIPKLIKQLLAINVKDAKIASRLILVPMQKVVLPRHWR